VVPDYEFISEDQQKDVIFRPNPGPQTEFLASPVREVLYGGAAGGGKSYAILADALRDMTHPQFRGLLVRRTTEELRELVQKSQELYPRAYPGIKWSERRMEWKAPSGATLWMSYLERDQDVTRYQGQAFSYIAFDELTQWATPFAWNYMRSRLRTTATDLPLYARATTNPGGPGHCVPFGEVLTVNGWRDIRKIKTGDQVYSLDKDTNLVIKTVSDTVQELYKGKMISRKNQMVFTENHRIPFKSNTGSLEIKPFYELPGQTNVYRACSNSLIKSDETLFTVPEFKSRKTRLNQPDTITAKQYAELMGWFLSEGHTLDRDKEFGISQCKPHNRAVIEKLLSDCEFSFRTSPICFSVSSPKWWAYMKQFGKCRDKFIPQEIKFSAYLKEFFFALMAGDGHWYTENSGTYYTTSERLKDDVMEVCVKLGYSVSFSSRARKIRSGLTYEINFTKRQTTEINTGNHLYNVTTTNSKVNVEKTDYEGIVYCITVPETETFFIRQNGYVWISGNTWVKKMFIDPSPWGVPFWATDIETGETLVWPKGHSKAGQPLFKRQFIPAKLADNPYLYNSGEYEANLLSLSENERRKLLDGDWDIIEGNAFPEFNRKIHVIEPFEIPRNWRRFRACDFGYGSHSAVLWFAITDDDELIVYRELYVHKVLAQDLANLVLGLESEDGLISYGVLDSSCWHQRGNPGPSIAEVMIAEGCRWRPSDRSKGSRVAGKNEVHRRLQVDEFTEKPRIFFFNNCINTISQLPVIPLDATNPDDVDTKSEDHIYDALRYGCMSRPRASIWDADANTRSNYTPFDKTFGY